MNKQQLANKIWASANKMRSKIDANEYKDYILGLIFYKFLSDTEVKYFIQDCGWEKDDLKYLVEDYEDLDMKTAIEECQNKIGFFIEYKYLFNAWIDGAEFNVAILSAALSNFERLMNDNFKSVYKDIFKTLSEGLSKLGDNPSSQTKALKDLIKLIKDIPTDGSQDYDVLGYVYEYLIGNFAANAGKKAGEFYTPHEVAMVMSEIVAEHHKNKSKLEIYDPTSGSGSLLITIGKAVSKHIQDKNSVKYYAQELKENTYNLTRMNLVMRGIIPQNIVTRCADTLEEDWPLHEEGSDINKPLAVDAVVSNPPYSQHWDPSNKEMDARFAQYGVAPKTKADYAFLLHELHHLKGDGIMTIVLPHGVLFRGGSEGEIRTRLIEKNNIDAIIGLPANIFFGTGIPTLVMVLRKNRGDEGVLIIDASKGFVKDGKQNKLRACDVKRIADAYRERKTVPGFCREVTREEIRKNEYNLNIPRYVDSSEAAVKYDIYSTMFGGIPDSEIADLRKYWDAFPSLKAEIFDKAEGKPYSTLKQGDLLDMVVANDDVQSFIGSYFDAFKSFGDMLRERLIVKVMQFNELKENDAISDDIFSRLQSIPLVDKYDVYQILADNWATVVGDIEIIQSEGIEACNVVEPKYKIVKDKDGNENEVEDGIKGRIMPFDLIQSRYFGAELVALRLLANRIEAVNGEVDAIVEDFNEDEQEAYLDSEKDNAIDKKKVADDAKNGIYVEAETLTKIKAIVKLWNEQKAAAKKLKEGQKALVEMTKEKIESLSKEEIDEMLDAKWITPVMRGINAMPVSIIEGLTDALRALNDKYAVSYHSIQDELSASKQNLAELVSQLTGDEHAIMGLNALIND